jgi:hypothetical protein
MSNKNNTCDTCGDSHPVVTHDSDCNRFHFETDECICGDNVMGDSGYVSVDLACIDNATESQ